jgi:hypothetical protein
MLQKRATVKGRQPFLGHSRLSKFLHVFENRYGTSNIRISAQSSVSSTSWDLASFHEDNYVDHVGPSASATLKMLEWHSLCEQVAEFASTHVGRRLCLAMQVPQSISETEALLLETRWYNPETSSAITSCYLLPTPVIEA